MSIKLLPYLLLFVSHPLMDSGGDGRVDCATVALTDLRSKDAEDAGKDNTRNDTSTSLVVCEQ